MDQEIQSQREDWEIIGYISNVQPPPLIILPVMRKKDNSDFWFFTINPGKNVKDLVKDMPKKDEQGQPYLGAPGFVELEEPLKYYTHMICVLLPKKFEGVNKNLVIQVIADDEIVKLIDSKASAYISS